MKEVVIRVRLRAENADDDNPVPEAEIGQAVLEGVRHALHYGEGEGFVHQYSNELSVTVASLELLDVTEHDSRMPLLEWLEAVFSKTWTQCYVALVRQLEGHWDIEIETVPGNIVGAVYSTDCQCDDEKDLERVQQLAKQLSEELTRRGVKVFKTRGKWENQEAD